MQSPIVISIASIIPGLGLWLIGKRRHAIIAFLLVLGSIFVFIFSPWETLTSLSCNVTVFLWAMQSLYAGYEAKLAQAVKSGNVQQAKEGMPITPPPSDLSRFEKEAFKAKEIVRQQLDMGEHVLDAIPAFQMSALQGAGSYRLYYLGLLQDKLAFVNTDFMGKPAGTERIDFSSIQSITVKHGLLQDNLIISINPKKLIKLRVTRWLRIHTDNFASAFAKQKGLQV
jgi:hypothetical protein